MVVIKNIDLAYKGDFCEQTAEFAIACGEFGIARTNYQRAIEAYVSGGWIKQALEAARKLGDRDKINELEEKLK